MTTPEDVPAIGLITLPRAVLSVAAVVLDSVERAVVGDDRVRTARGNAWDAICADRARAQARDDTRRLIATLAAGRTPARAGRAPATTARTGTARPDSTRPGTAQSAVGSSPRSSASHAARVSTGLVASGPAPRR